MILRNSEGPTILVWKQGSWMDGNDLQVREDQDNSQSRNGDSKQGGKDKSKGSSSTTATPTSKQPKGDKTSTTSDQSKETGNSNNKDGKKGKSNGNDNKGSKGSAESPSVSTISTLQSPPSPQRKEIVTSTPPPAAALTTPTSFIIDTTILSASLSPITMPSLTTPSSLSTSKTKCGRPPTSVTAEAVSATGAATTGGGAAPTAGGAIPTAEGAAPTAIASQTPQLSLVLPITQLPQISPIPQPTSVSDGSHDSHSSDGLHHSDSAPATGSLNQAVIAGAVVGAIVGFALLAFLGICCVRGRHRGKFQNFHLPAVGPKLASLRSTIPSFPLAAPKWPSVMRKKSGTGIQSMFGPPAPAEFMAQKTSEDPPTSEKKAESIVTPEAGQNPISPLSPRTPVSEKDSTLSIDPSFMGTISAILTPSQAPSLTSRPSSHQRSESNYSRSSDLRSGSIKSDSTIILPHVFPRHSRTVSDQKSMYAPNRFNPAKGPWRDSVWSASATPTSALPPGSRGTSYFPGDSESRSASYAGLLASERNSRNWAPQPSALR